MVLKYGLLALAYLLGAIPFSIILGKKIKGIDVREHGSGNPGGTNSLRFLGKKVGLWVLFLDGFKAFIIVFLVQIGAFDSIVESTGVELLHPLAYGVTAAIGHVYSVYIKFKGGKAVACTVGMMIAFNIGYALIMFVVFMTVLKVWKYVSLASTSAAVTMFIIGIVVGFATEQGWDMAIFSSVMVLLVTFRHRTNFQKIKLGTESKVSWI